MFKLGVATAVLSLSVGTASVGATDKEAAEYLICDVEMVDGLTDKQTAKFGISNGSTKGTDNGFIISVELDGDTLHYTNLNNNADMRMSRLSGEAGATVYGYGRYQFVLKDSQSRFEFHVNKDDYNAMYSGSCRGK